MKLPLYALLSLLSVVACTSDDDFSQNKPQHHRVKMQLVGGINGFDHTQLRATDNSTDWQVGDVIYLDLGKSVKGTATYTAQGWVVDYDGTLSTGEGQTCTAQYFENATSATDYLVQLSPTSAHYSAKGSYNYVDGELTLFANLTPATGRVRFKGTPGSKVYVAGPEFYASYTPSTGLVTRAFTAATLTVDESGYTPYVYGAFQTIAMGYGENPTTHNLSVACGESAYTRTCSSDVLSQGKSGYFTVPTESEHTGWRVGFTLRIKSYDLKELDLKMMPVPGFDKGYFLLGETEVTNRLFNTVISQSTNIYDPNKACEYTSVLQFEEFCTDLSNQTGLQFFIPTIE